VVTGAYKSYALLCIVMLVLTGPAVAESCAIPRIEALVTSCITVCISGNDLRVCAAVGKIGIAARDANGDRLILGYEQCASGSKDKDGDIKECVRAKPRETIDAVRVIYGYSPLASSEPPPPPEKCNCRQSPFGGGTACVPKATCVFGCQGSC